MNFTVLEKGGINWQNMLLSTFICIIVFFPFFFCLSWGRLLGIILFFPFIFAYMYISRLTANIVHNIIYVYTYMYSFLKKNPPLFFQICKSIHKFGCRLFFSTHLFFYQPYLPTYLTKSMPVFPLELQPFPAKKKKIKNKIK
jgi:hypothetical protein